MTEDSQANAPAVGWRFKIGIALFALSFVPPLFGIPLLAMMELSPAIATTLSGVMLVGAEVIGLISIAVLGKDGFNYIKGRIFGFFKQLGPPASVSRTRYRVGIVMFSTILGMALGGWISAWLYDLTGSYAAAIWNGIGWNLMNAAIALTILFRIGQYQAARAR
jgi:hypothetical protein